MERVSLEAETRSEVGKVAVKKLRERGFIPGVVYKAKEGTTNLKVAKSALLKVLHTEAGENVIINLKLSPDADSLTKKSSRSPKSSAGKGTKTVIIKEIQYHPVKGDILHIDFNQISLTEKLTIDVPLETKGESEGVKEGGILEHILWELKVECLPTKIPEKIEVDVSDLKIGDFVYVKDLKVPQDIKILTEPEAIVVSVKPPTVEKVEEEKVEEEITEPEVITEKKEEEAEESEKQQEKEK
jgi:large subunit ribosomal protein L25